MHRVGVWLWGLSVVLAALSFTRAEPSMTGRAKALPTQLAPFTQSQWFDVTPRMHQLLGTDDATWRSYDDETGRRLFVVADHPVAGGEDAAGLQHPEYLRK